ncbi:MAG: hypothetical protein B6U89_01715 [Desulfurococcales archaeon ex4484_58]|nr:MAG: hypothetical protein B6U89_01715 [Desulfurococcales archaeon ex4484_58]
MHKDLYIVLVYSNDGYSEMIREIVEYAIEIVSSKYGLNISYKRILANDIDYPYIVINGLDPIAFEEKPSLKTLIDLFLITADSMGINPHINDPMKTNDPLTS